MESETMRLFLALRITGSMNRALSDLLRELKKQGIGGSFVAPENLHATLAFIGETDRAKDIEAAVGSVPVPPLRITLDGSEMFGSILVARVRPDEELLTYAKDIRKALDGAGIWYDGREYRPHITLIRRMQGDPEQIRIPQGSMDIRRVSLMRSGKVRGRSVYTEIAGWDAG